LLWITVTCGLFWYGFVVIPDHFKDPANVKNIITGVVVGVITVIMLIMNFVTVAQFLKRYGQKRLQEVRA
jgi:hypothetical protein